MIALLLAFSILLAVTLLFCSEDCDSVLDGYQKATLLLRVLMLLATPAIPLIILSLWLLYWTGLLGPRHRGCTDMLEGASDLLRRWRQAIIWGETE